MDQFERVKCLFCKSGYERLVVECINETCPAVAIFPKKVKRLLKQGEWLECSVPLMPGYIFVYANEDVTYAQLRSKSRVLKVLRYAEDITGELQGDDRAFADWIWRSDGMIGCLEAVKIGDWVEITDPMLQQLHGRVVKMDRRKQMVKLELDVLGSARSIWLNYELVQKANETESSKRMEDTAE